MSALGQGPFACFRPKADVSLPASGRPRRERRAVTHQPDVTERIGEASLPVDAPRPRVVGDTVDAAGSSGLQRTGHEPVRVIAEDLDLAEAIPRLSGVSQPFFAGWPRKNGALEISRPATGPKRQSATAPNARSYQATATSTSATASITDSVGGLLAIAVTSRDITRRSTRRQASAPLEGLLSRRASKSASPKDPMGSG